MIAVPGGQYCPDLFQMWNDQVDSLPINFQASPSKVQTISKLWTSSIHEIHPKDLENIRLSKIRCYVFIFIKKVLEQDL